MNQTPRRPMQPGPPLHLPDRNADSHKGDFGRALLIGGSRGMAGSIALSSMAALKTGSGLVTAAVPDRCLDSVAAFHPCLMTIPLTDQAPGQFATEASSDIESYLKSFDAIGCGPGMTTGAGAVRMVERLLLQTALPRLFDADAINVLSKLDWIDSTDAPVGPIVLTPHPGELQRLTGVSASDRPAQLDAADTIADRLDIVIVVKGGPTVVIKKGERWTNTTGNAGMATGGAGDVLTGVITSLLGQGLCPWDASRLGVWAHGSAGDLAADKYGQAGMTAMEILECLPLALQ